MKFDFTCKCWLIIILSLEIFLIFQCNTLLNSWRAFWYLVAVLIWYWEIIITMSNQIKSPSCKYHQCENTNSLDKCCNSLSSRCGIMMLCTSFEMARFLWQTKWFDQKPVGNFYCCCNRKSKCTSITSSKSSCNLWKDTIK